MSSYDSDFFAPLYASEDSHFWFVTRNQVIASLTNRLVNALPAGYRVLELGCGTGNVLRVLERQCAKGIVTGMDLFRSGLQYAQLRTTCSLVQADIHHLPFRASFDLVGLFDVLEHLSDDMQVLTDIRTMLRSDGRLLLTVPAHRSLWSYFDEAARHCRRYELAELRNKLLDSGYCVDYITYYMASLFPFVWMGRRLAGWRSRFNTASIHRNIQDLTVQELRIVPGVNQVITFILAQENRFIARLRPLPVGTSLLAVARKIE